MSENPVPTINQTDLTSDWFDSLERCFKWSDRLQQKPLPAGSGSGGASIAQSAAVAAYMDGIYGGGNISSKDS